MADRVDKRRTVLSLQSLMLLEALALAVLTHLGLITVHWVMGLAAFYGLLSAFEVPARQAMVSEIVGKTDLMNAIALNSSAFNVARVIGPSIAGALIATVGLAACFYLNAASYLAVVVGLLLMRVEPSARREPVPAFGALREGFWYIFGNSWPRALIIIVAGFSIFGYSFIPMMPVFARDVLGLDADGYGAIVSAVGLGAAAGAIGMAATGGGRRGGRMVIGSFAAFGVLLTAAAYAPGFWSAGVLFTLAGVADVHERDPGQHHAPARGARRAARPGDGVLLVRGPRRRAPRRVPGGVGVGAFRGAGVVRARRDRVCVAGGAGGVRGAGGAGEGSAGRSTSSRAERGTFSATLRDGRARSLASLGMTRGHSR